jgi:small subunit ribosomal protein S21
MRVHDREPIGAALRRFKKLLERSGVTKELRNRKYYEKPCEVRRRAKLRKLSAIRKGEMQTRNGSYRETVNKETECLYGCASTNREPIGMALRRFKKLLERSGVTRELRKRKYYEKPCEVRRRAALRKQLAMRKARVTEGTRQVFRPGERSPQGKR